MNACPACGAALTGNPGERVVCPACFAEVDLVAPAAPAVLSWDVLLVDGTRHEDIGRALLRERIYTGRYPTSVRVSPTGRNEWLPVHEVEEAQPVFALLGTEMPLASGTRRIAGWRGTQAPEARSLQSRPAGTTRPPPRPTRAVPVVAEGAVVRTVAGGEEEIELDEELAPEAPTDRPMVPPAPKAGLLLPLLLLGALVALGSAVAVVLLFGG